MTRSTLVVASGNAGKLRELRALLDGLDLTLRSLGDYPSAPAVEETGDSYLDNARLKAHALAGHAGIPALADDSGLEVDALGGAPGVRSARFAADAGIAGTGDRDADNIALLLQRLRQVPDAQRSARFRCVVVVAAPDGRELTAEGTCDGMITRAARGGGGFGYDPVFFCPLLGHTFAEVSAAEKDRISHRAQAVVALRAALRGFLA